MIAFRFLLLLGSLSLCRLALGAESITVHKDGTVQGDFWCGISERRPMLLSFGLPQAPPARTWREGEALCSLWVTNGIKYTQKALIARLAADGKGLGTTGPEVLLINIEGENTNSQYADAYAALAVEIAGKPGMLELKEGFIWLSEGEGRYRLGAVEIPESGVKTPQGDTLRFYGSIPPSLKGSMTVKFPLEPLQDEAADRLRDMAFEDELRQILKGRKNALEGRGRLLLTFAGEEPKRKKSEPSSARDTQGAIEGR